MKTFKILVTCVLLFTPGCSDKKKELSDLIDNKNYNEAQKFRNYNEAQKLINNLSDDEKNSDEIKELQKTLNFARLCIALSMSSHAVDYLTLDSIISSSIEEYKNDPTLKDSLNSLRKFYAFEGVRIYLNHNNPCSAYRLIARYENDNHLFDDQRRLIDNIKMKMISGIWAGTMLKGRMNVKMRIDPINSSAFTGRVHFEEMNILTELYDCSFNGKEITATYSIRASPYRFINEGVYGIFENQKLKMTFPIVVNYTKTEYDGYGTSQIYRSKIVKKDCLMSKINN